MKTPTIPMPIAAAMAASSLAAMAASYNDDFNGPSLDPAKWELEAEGGNLVLDSGRLNYVRSGTPTSDDFAALLFTGAEPAYDESWEVIVDVANTAPRSNPSTQHTGAGILILDNENFDTVNEIFLELSNENRSSVVFSTNFITNGQDFPFLEDAVDTGETSGSMRISYNGETKVFSIWVDYTGSDNGYQWQLLSSCGIAGSGGIRNTNWGMSPLGSFQILLYGLSANLVVNTGSVTLDNFHYIEAEPPPEFDASAITSSGLEFVRGGDAFWSIQDAVRREGRDFAASSGNTAHNSSSWIETTVTGPGTLTFWRRVSSEEEYDLFRVSLDGVIQMTESGELDWAMKTILIPEGTRTVRWEYLKDNIISSGLDAVFLDEIVWTPEVGAGDLVTVQIDLVENEVLLTINPTVSGLRYQAQQSITMESNDWENAGEEQTGTGGPLVIAVPRDPLADRCFYRIAVIDPTGEPGELALIPAGPFMIGDSMQNGEAFYNEWPRHQVQIGSFRIATNEVTKALWDEVRTWGLDNGYTDLPVGGGKAADHPVHSISWYAAVKWCNARSEMEGLTPCYTVSGSTYKLGDNSAVVCNWVANGYRLPTNAEWEKAARGGLAGKRFAWGDIINHTHANYNSWNFPYESPQNQGSHPDYNSGGTPYTSPVASFAPNGYGLHDTAGNIREWCWDRYDEEYYSDTHGSMPTDPRGPDTGTTRVSRGGSWGNDAIYCRVSARRGINPTNTSTENGFRLARSIP